MGILKVTVANIPADAYYLYLQDPNGTFAFSGTYAVGDQDEIRAQDAVSPSGNNFKKTIAFTPQSAGETRTFFFPLPTGTIPAGTLLKLDKGYSGGFDNIMTKTFTKPITIQAGHVKPLAAVSAVPMDDVLGTYTMTVTSSDYSTNNKAGMLVIEESDDPSKGNVMITKFADIEGKQYGTFDGSQLVFPADQLFAANPYSTDYPYIALDAYTGGVTDAQFTVIEPGHIRYEGEAIGFRATSQDLWFNDSHNGAWPWSLAFGSLEATRITPISLSESMISVSANETYLGDDGGPAALVDGDTGTHWHSPWSFTGTFDSTYGVYIDVDLGSGNELTKFIAHFHLRNSLNDHPDHIKIYASADGSNWGSALADMENIYATYGPNSWTAPIPFTAASPSRYVRIAILSTNGYNGTVHDLTSEGCTHMAEIELYNME